MSEISRREGEERERTVLGLQIGKYYDVVSKLLVPRTSKATKRRRIITSVAKGGMPLVRLDLSCGQKCQDSTVDLAYRIS